MMFKNSIKLLLTNFSSVWKLLVYKLIVLVIVGLLFWISIPALSTLGTFQTLNESFWHLLNFFSVASNPTEVVAMLFDTVTILVGLILDIATILPGTFIYLILLFFLVLPALWHLGDVAIGETLYGYMASQTKYGFCSSIIKKLKASIGYSLLYTLIVLPYNLLILMALYGLMQLASLGSILILILPFLIFVFLLFSLSLKTTILCGVMPALVVFDCSVTKAFKIGLKAVSRRFYRTWSTSVIFNFILMAILMFFGTYSAILVIPIGAVTLLIFGMVMFFGSQGMRFYVDPDTIITPKRLEETDSIKKVKYLI